MKSDTQFTTPIGIARYPWINVPNTTFDENGVYKCDILVTEKEGKVFAKKIKEELKPFYEATLQREGKKKLKLADLPCRPFEGDDEDDGEPMYLIRAKQDAVFSNKAGNKSFTAKIIQYDSKNNVVSEQVGSGTRLKMSVNAYFWYTPSLGVGCTLRLKAVQILELQAPNAPSEQSAEQLGFSSESQGFVGTGEVLPFSEDKTPDADEDSDEEEEFDF